MNWEAIGALGEVGGAIAVVASLLYVARQIRQNSSLIEQSARVATGSTFHASNTAYTRVYGLIAGDASLAEIYRRGLAAETLDPSEVVRFEALLQHHFAWLENAYHQQRLLLIDGMNSEEFSVIPGFAPFYRRLLRADYARSWWRREARYQYTEVFYAEATRVFLEEDDDGAPQGAPPH